jgi:ribosomal protein S18 acetylase RimI-like enzyme
MNVRCAAREDIPAVLALWAEARALAATSTEVAALERLVESQPRALLVAEEDRLVGSLIAVWDGWRGNMYRLTVLPALRRQGIAHALVDAAHDHFRQLEVSRV